ncbi:MAG: hypothetical protein ACETVZ_05785 [Phycisphaerae bacterium]
MNKAQKGAWFTLGLSILLFAFGIIIFIAMFTSGTIGTGLVIFWSLLILTFMIVPIFFLRRKQSLAEVVVDERDNSIRKNAVLASFISVWILLFVASIIPSYVVGQYGSIPVILLPIINFGIFLVILLVYSIAILIQYGWRGKENE